MSIKKDILWRVALVYLGSLIFGIIIIFKVIYLQFINHDEWEKKARKNALKIVSIEPHRGDIYAVDMRLLASSVPYYNLYMDMRAPSLTQKSFYNNLDSLCLCMAKLFPGEESAAQYKRRLKKAYDKGIRYYLVKSKVDYYELKKIRKFPIFRDGRYKGGFIIDEQSYRVRPHKNLAARTIGYTTRSKRGNIVGLEGAYDSILAGIEGRRLMQRLAGGVWMPVSDKNEVDPKDGDNIVSTIDIDLQDITENALLRQLEKHDALRGTAVLMEVQTGEIKAIANLTDTFGSYREFYNLAVGEIIEPGSTFKLPVLMAALEDGVVDLDDTVNTGNGIIDYYDITIKDDSYLSGGYGPLSVKEVFELSSNIGMSKIIYNAYKNDPTRFTDLLYKMGIHNKVGVEIKGEQTPDIKYPGHSNWKGVSSLIYMSFGYGVRLTPLQILTFYNAVANDGKMMKPMFIKEIQRHGKVIKKFKTEVLNSSICSQSTIRKARKMMEGVVENGTATNLKSAHLKIAGKTGTNLMYNRQEGSYRGKGEARYQALFVGYFPADNPKYSCIVVIQAPKKESYYGNKVAGPVFLEIANKIYAKSVELQQPLIATEERPDLPYSKIGDRKDTEYVLKTLNLPFVSVPGAEWIKTRKGLYKVHMSENAMVADLMPNVVTMGLKDAIYLLENMGLNVEVIGRGSIRSQSISAGSIIRPGQKITLELSFIEG